jgi:hypothetical protein
MRTKRGQQAPRYAAKIGRRSYLVRLAWWIVRRYALNEDYYRIVTRFTGPRPYSRHSTRREDATAFRYYLEPRPHTRRI